MLVYNWQISLQCLNEVCNCMGVFIHWQLTLEEREVTIKLRKSCLSPTAIHMHLFWAVITKNFRTLLPKFIIFLYVYGRKKSRLSSSHCPSYIRCVGFVAAKETWYLVLFEVPFLLVIQSVLINSNTECLWNGIFIFGEKQDIVTVAVLISHVSTDVLSALILFLLNVHGVWRGENNISMFSLHLRKDIYRKPCMFCVLRVILKAATSIGTG